MNRRQQREQAPRTPNAVAPCSRSRNFAKRLECVQLAGAFGSWFQCASDCWRWRLPTNRPLERRLRGEKRVSRSENSLPASDKRGESRREGHLTKQTSSPRIQSVQRIRKKSMNALNPWGIPVAGFRCVKREKFRRNLSPASLPSPEERIFRNQFRALNLRTGPDNLLLHMQQKVVSAKLPVHGNGGDSAVWKISNLFGLLACRWEFPT